MVYTRKIKETYGLRRVVEQDLGPPPIRSGRTAAYKCPFHHEQKGHSLVVWDDGYRCFGRCDTAGDLFDWLMRYRRLSFAEALAALGEKQGDHCIQEHKPQAIPSEPPPHAWQQAARQVVDIAEETLWSSAGEPALNSLLKERGLTIRTIRGARLGYIPGDLGDWRLIAGLRVPCGITIPWFAAGALWALKVRRASGTPKYVQIADGSAHGLYNGDALCHCTIALFCEGEFDALLSQQEAGDVVSAVTLGSASARLSARWHGALVGLRTIFVAYDRDAAGRQGMQRLLDLSPRFQALALPTARTSPISTGAVVTSMLGSRRRI